MATLRSLMGLVVLGLASVAAMPRDAGAQDSARPPAVDVVGTTLRARLPDGSMLEGRALTGAVLTVAVGGQALRIRIAGVEADARDPQGEVLLYDFRVVTAQGEQPLCAPDPDGRSLGLPLAGRSDRTGAIAASDDTFELFCTGAAQAKCVRFGYAPWRQAPDGQSMRDWYNACVRMVRGDYCGDGVPFTRNGTWIDLYDSIGVQKSDGDPSLAFEAGWGPDGAVCIARPRVPELATLDRLVAACPKLKDRVGAMCTEDTARAQGARIFNRSRP